jgi:S-adenosylmethionine synthetase
MGREYLFTSESVTEGHPDKMCDQISDEILDAVLKKDLYGRVACESLTTRGLVFVAGEISTKAYVDIPGLVRNVIREVGYANSSYGFNFDSSAVITAIQEQSSDIALGVDKGGAGDQGMMFGYAVRETEEYMPMPLMQAHALVKKLDEVRKKRELPYLRPDGKSQVTIRYVDDTPVEIVSVVLSAQHDENIDQGKIRKDLIEAVIETTIPQELMAKKMTVYVNPTGSFTIGGPQADTGVTGRKIIVDTYGGVGRHGGGCFSGKDPSKVDRSASYFARYIAKNIVASEIADRCDIQLAYIIGETEPVSLSINCYGTARVPEDSIIRTIRKNLDLTPEGIITKLDLRRPIYRKTATYGHFGRTEPEFTWEQTDLVSLFKGV